MARRGRAGGICDGDGEWPAHPPVPRRTGRCRRLPRTPAARADTPWIGGSVVHATAPLLTPPGLRSLDPADPAYRPRHRGGPRERDAAYHQGTVWPWLVGPYVDAALAAGLDPAPVVSGLEAHLLEGGLGSVSETADGDPPHATTGCPFQAWSVAELLRARRQLETSVLTGQLRTAHST